MALLRTKIFMYMYIYIYTDKVLKNILLKTLSIIHRDPSVTYKLLLLYFFCNEIKYGGKG